MIDDVNHLKCGHYDVNEPFRDGFLTIICYDYEDDSQRMDRLTICAEYDEPYTLDRVLEEYPDAKMVIFECALGGAIYRYNNYGDSEWHKIGKTIGYV